MFQILQKYNIAVKLNKANLNDLIRMTQNTKNIKNIKKTFSVIDGFVNKTDVEKFLKEYETFETKKMSDEIKCLEKTYTKDLNPDTSDFDSFYITHDSSDYIDANVVYLAVIGYYKKNVLMKYGKSSRIFEREIEHKRTFGNQFKIIYVNCTDNNNMVEMKFENVIKSKKLHVERKFCNKNQKEIFTLSPNFLINDAIKLFDKLVLENPLKSIKERDDKIKELECMKKNDIHIEKEHTKQLEIQRKIKLLEKEIEFKKLSFNYCKNEKRKR